VRRALVAVAIGAAGFSTIETAAVLGAMSAATVGAAPHLKQYLETARQLKAVGEVRVISLSITRLMLDIGQIRSGPARPSLLVGPGSVPGGDEPSVQPWLAPIDDTATETLEGHLIMNVAGYDERWRGPYMEGLGPDPWGSRYAANVGLFSAGKQTVMTLSAGPNKIIETAFAQTGLRLGGDDIASIIGR